MDKLTRSDCNPASNRFDKITHVVQCPYDGQALFFPARSRAEAYRLTALCQPMALHSLQKDKKSAYPFCMTTLTTFKYLLKCIDFSLDKVLFSDPEDWMSPEQLEKPLPVSSFRWQLKTTQLWWRTSPVYAWWNKPDMLPQLKAILKDLRRRVILREIQLTNPSLFY